MKNNIKNLNQSHEEQNIKNQTKITKAPMKFLLGSHTFFLTIKFSPSHQNYHTKEQLLLNPLDFRQ